jgi:hypothetical protein
MVSEDGIRLTPEREDQLHRKEAVEGIYVDIERC